MKNATNNASIRDDEALHAAPEALELPRQTLRAAMRANGFPGLSARARIVLATLARTVDHRRPGAKIFARRALLQDRAMISERTFFRALADLEEAKLIVRFEHWSTSGRAGYNRAYIAMSEQAIAALFTDHHVERRHVKASPTIRRQQCHRLASNAPGNRGAEVGPDVDTNVGDEPVVHTETYPQFGKSTATLAEPIKEDLNPSKQERQPGQLPADLQPLLGLGFGKFFVFKLMREARERGKRLSDVISATWNHLSKAHSPISYLRALLKSPTDFSALARELERESQLQATALRNRQDYSTTARALAGKWFSDVTSDRRFEISSDGAIVSIHEPGQTIRSAGGIWQVAFVAALNSGKIRAEPVGVNGAVDTRYTSS